MALQVIEAACQATPDMSKAVIVVRSTLERENGSFQKAFDELGDLNARAVAQKFAAQRGMGQPRINGNINGPYPVNADGVPLDQVKEQNGDPVPPTDPRMQPKWYQIEVPLAGPVL